MDHTEGERWSGIVSSNAVTRSTAERTHISFVLNELSTSPGADYEWHSVITEYLNEAEASEIITAAKDAGFSATTYDGERAFIAAVLDGTWQAIPFEEKYVFNTTGSGVGRARTSLIPAFCDLNHIRICSADGFTAAVLENKINAFRLLDGLGFPIPRTYLYKSGQWDGGPPDQGMGVIAKPCHECASIGIDKRAIFTFEDRPPPHLDEMCRVYRQPILVQEFIEGFEVEVPVFPCPRPTSPAAIGISLNGTRRLGDRVLENKTIVEDAYDFYDFAGDHPQASASMVEIAEEIYSRMGFSGLVRVDFRVTDDQRVFVTDVNTPPHLTRHSSCHFAFASAGLAHADLITSLVTAGRLASRDQ